MLSNDGGGCKVPSTDGIGSLPVQLPGLLRIHRYEKIVFLVKQ
jgi:hypothetical protein